jgi:hypothetical protein
LRGYIRLATAAVLRRSRCSSARPFDSSRNNVLLEYQDRRRTGDLPVEQLGNFPSQASRTRASRPASTSRQVLNDNEIGKTSPGQRWSAYREGTSGGAIFGRAGHARPRRPTRSVSATNKEIASMLIASLIPGSNTEFVREHRLRHVFVEHRRDFSCRGHTWVSIEHFSS